jgi:hypothetical protein
MRLTPFGGLSNRPVTPRIDTGKEIQMKNQSIRPKRTPTKETAAAIKATKLPPEPDMDQWNRECAARELSEAVGHFLKRATESELLKIRDVLLFAEMPDTTLSSAIIKAMRGEVITAPKIEGFDLDGFMQRVKALGYRQSLLAGLTALERNGGSSTPAEEFIDAMLYMYECKGLTPEAVEWKLEQFRDNYDYTSREVALFIQNNPQKFKDMSECLRETKEAKPELLRA